MRPEYVKSTQTCIDHIKKTTRKGHLLYIICKFWFKYTSLVYPTWAASIYAGRSKSLANRHKLSVHLWQFSWEGREYLQTSLKLFFGATKMVVCANKLLYACLLQNHGNVYWVDIIYLIIWHLIVYEIKNFWYYLFELVSKLDNNNNDYSHVRHIRRGVYNSLSEYGKHFFFFFFFFLKKKKKKKKKKKLSSVICFTKRNPGI